ncbi:MAG: HPr(Ser) kinase/phosphatase [Xanthomonadales bacterium]|nr:HPr(Ser) kinase/phosphatase [Xanthomonadales bacterium]
MDRRITAGRLFEDLAERLGLRWIAGEPGRERALSADPSQRRRPSLAGYLNIIYPNRVQIVGQEELAYLDGLDARQRWETIAKIIDHRPLALIITRNQPVPGDLAQACRESETPLWHAARPGHEVLAYMQYHLTRALAPRITLHGVFMEIYSIGVLITGEAGAGKSELALELITRGHRLIADDAPEFTQIAPDILDGTCPEMLQDLLEVRGLGVLDVREMFGDTAIKRNKYLRLIVHLEPFDPRRADPDDGMRRIFGDTATLEVLGVPIPKLCIPVAPGRNLAVLVEAAARSYILKSKGIDPAKTFVDRQAHQLRRQRPW